MSTYGRDETLLPAHSHKRNTCARRGQQAMPITREREESCCRGEGSLMLCVGGGGKGFQVATPSYCTPVVQSLQLLSALTVLLAEK